MRKADLIRLVFLAAIWGASFLFTRIVAPVLGAVWTAETRVTVAGIAMLLFLIATNRKIDIRANWKPYLVLGTLNSALPFALFSYAAITLPAGYSAIVNATSPLWGALIGAAVLGEALTTRKIAGLLAGITGVAFLVRLGPVPFSHDVMLAALACLSAAFCYGISGAYSKKVSKQMAPQLMATGSQLGSILVLVPFLTIVPIRGEVTLWIVVVAAALALLCSAVAYFMYFRLIADIGPTKALTVTFLVPLFALLWGALFLHETINVNTVIGCGLVVLATWLVVFQKKAAAPVAPH